MAALTRPTQATYEVHENISVDTQDNEDHTFCGIMFPVKCKDLLPLDHLLIKSVAVRGRLGPLTVWVSNPEEHETGQWQPPPQHHLRSDHHPPVRPQPQPQQQQQRIRLDPQYWTKLYDKTHPPSRTEYAELALSDPIRLVPGQTRVIYIHSTLPGDDAIVYDNSSFHNNNAAAHSKRYEDDRLCIQSGRAHVSPEVFGQEPIWGWGNAWRDRREFVGRLTYGTVYKLWSPRLQPKFGGKFREGARTLFLCQRRWESPLSMLGDECIFYILNMCPWHHFDDDSDAMKARKKQEKVRLLKQQQEEEKNTEMPNAAVATSNRNNNNSNTAAEEVEEDSKPAAVCASRCEAARQRVCAMLDHSDDDDDNDEEQYNDCAEDEDDQKVPAVDEEGNVIVDLDDMEEYVPSENDDEEDEEDEWSEESGEAQYYRANVEAFTFQEVNSDSED